MVNSVINGSSLRATAIEGDSSAIESFPEVPRKDFHLPAKLANQLTSFEKEIWQITQWVERNDLQIVSIF